MINFEIGIAILFSALVLYIVIRLAMPRDIKRSNTIVFEDTTATPPWAQQPAAAPLPQQTIVAKEAKDTATNYHSVTVAVYIPLLLALVSGTIAALFTLFIIKIWWSWLDALTGAGAMFMLVAAVVWLWRLVDWQKLIHQVEVFTQSDIDNDTFIGDPVDHVEIKHYDKNGTWTRTHSGDIDLTHDEKRKLAFALLMQKRSFSEDALARAEDGYSKLFSQPRFSKVQDQFIALEMVNKKGSGYELNDDGEKYLLPFLPSPTAESVSLPTPVGKVGIR
jgi:hypothetical protein